MRLPLVALLLVAPALQAQTLPLRQSKLDASARDASLRVPLDSTVDARWLGIAPGGGGVAQ